MGRALNHIEAARITPNPGKSSGADVPCHIHRLKIEKIVAETGLSSLFIGRGGRPHGG